MSAQITANHKGFFEFRLCPQNRTDVAASESCMERWHLIYSMCSVLIIGGFQACFTINISKAPPGCAWRRKAVYAPIGHRLEKNVTLTLILLFVILPLWYPPPNHHPPGIFSTEIALPKGLTCSHCVLQWRYVGGERFYHLQLSSMCVLEFRWAEYFICSPLHTWDLWFINNWTWL